MVYILICIAALIICYTAGFGITKLITRKKSAGFIKKLILTFVSGTVLLLILSLGYLSVPHKAEQRALDALKGNDSVTVTAVQGGYFFDGPGNDTAMIFYPGAKVECEAYAPLMLIISEDGTDCFLADMPFSFAIFGVNNAENFLKSYQYKNWIMSGHSMGGMAAANYTAGHPEQISGLVLLAAYPSKPIGKGTALLSVYGSEDGCLNLREYEKDKANWPSEAEEILIEGGNHAQFGNYGKQQKDGEALISSAEQQKKAAENIRRWKESAGR